MWPVRTTTTVNGDVPHYCSRSFSLPLPARWPSLRATEAGQCLGRLNDPMPAMRALSAAKAVQCLCNVRCRNAPHAGSECCRGCPRRLQCSLLKYPPCGLRVLQRLLNVSALFNVKMPAMRALSAAAEVAQCLCNVRCLQCPPCGLGGRPWQSRCLGCPIGSNAIHVGSEGGRGSPDASAARCLQCHPCGLGGTAVAAPMPRPSSD